MRNKLFLKIAMKRLLFLLFTLLLTAGNTHAQIPAPENLGIEVNVLGGRIMKHTSSIVLPVPESAFAVQVNFLQHTSGKKAWQQRWNKPVIGLGLMYTDYGDNRFYGRALGIYPNIQLRFINNERFKWFLSVGGGFGLASRHYDRTPFADTMNNFIGSTINNFSVFDMSVQYRVSKYLSVQAGGNLTHLSNGNFTVPNLGLNLVAFHAGITYYPYGLPSHEGAEVKADNQRNSWNLNVKYTMGFVQLMVPGGPRYPVYGLGVYPSKTWLKKMRAFAGLDLALPTGTYTFIKNNELFKGEELQRSLHASVFAGNEFLLGRCGIQLQVGYTYYGKFLMRNKVYQKLGGNVYLYENYNSWIKRLYLSVLLKTYLTNADFVEFGVGAAI